MKHISLKTFFKLFSLFVAITLVQSLLCGCGQNTSGGGQTSETTDDLRRLTVSLAGKSQAKASPNASVSIKTIANDGSVSPPFATVSDIKDGFFIQKGISIDIRKKRGFLVEYKGGSPLHKIIWYIRDGYNNIGLLDDTSTLITAAILDVLPDKNIDAEDISFFAEYLQPDDINGLLKSDDTEREKVISAEIKSLMRMWAESRRKYAPPDFTWGPLDNSRAGVEKNRAFSQALFFLYLLNSDPNPDYVKWRPVFYHALLIMFLDEMNNVTTVSNNDIIYLRKCASFTVSLRDAVKGKYQVPARKTQQPEEAVDEHFMTEVTTDTRYDPRRKLGYNSVETAGYAKYDSTKPPEKSLSTFFETFNKTLESGPFDDKLKKRCTVDIKQLDAFATSAADSIFAEKKKAESVAEQQNIKPTLHKQISN